ncbi:tetratricopeptide repeat protein [Sedimentibacter sp.]|uniref:tetratricopeptide repeat protein n=1 Tax=Sedimentibacter sp. TaxID=1960295 RepID=UPI0028A777C4|nr:tetratricopeptide repeat protein [Sedimentibacter sp.]
MIKLKSEKFKKLINEATEKLRNDSFDESYKIIKNALCENPDAPEPHNLLGLWYEKNRNYDLARKHYRAAYALDPTYKSATVNLERVCTMFSGRQIPLDFGENLEDSNIDSKNIIDKEATVNVRKR